MKKLFLLFSAGVISLGAGAQNKQSLSVVHTEGKSLTPLPISQFEHIKGFGNRTTGTANKTTAGGSRIYNYIETIAALNQNIVNNSNLPYMWFRDDMLAAYNDGNGNTIADTIQFPSYAALLHPFADILNNDYYADAMYPSGDGTLMGVSKDDAYTLDSVSVYGYYGRNKDNTTTVDTLRFAFIYGDLTEGSNIGENGFTGGNNIRFGSILHDTVNNVGAGVQGGPAVVYQDLLLTAADTVLPANSYPRFTVPANLSVPAGNVVAVTVTFKSGEDGTYTPYEDTAFLGQTWRPDNPFKYGLFRPLFFEETVGQQPSYEVGDYNAGYVKFFPYSRFQSWEQLYIPHWAFEGGFVLEWPAVEFYISCAACKTVAEIPDPPKESVAITGGIFSDVTAYPNPAQDYVRIPVTLSKATDVKVSLVNTVGQVLQTQQLHGNAVTAEFNTAGIPAGVYIYSVEADGQRSTGRVSISR